MAQGLITYLLHGVRAARWQRARLVALAACFLGVLVIPSVGLGAVGHHYVSQLTETPLNASPSGPLVAPSGLAVDSHDNVWVMDSGAGVVDEFNSLNGFVSQQSGGGRFSLTERIRSVAVASSSGDLYVANSSASVVDVFDSTGNFLTAWTGSNTPKKKFGEGGPMGVAIDQSTGDVYVVGTQYQVVDKFNSEGVFQSQITSTGFTGNNTVSMAAFGGRLYVLTGSGIAEFDSAGKSIGLITGAETPAKGFYFEPTLYGLNGFTAAVSGIATDSAGNIYVADSLHGVVDEFDTSGKYVGQINGGGTPAGAFIDPGGVAVNSSGDVYVSDFDPRRSSANEGTGVVDIFGPAVVQHSLTVTRTGVTETREEEYQEEIGKKEVYGRVTSSPGGINTAPKRINQVAGVNPNCFVVCSAQFDPNTSVTLTATPGVGFKFTEWSGPAAGGCGSESTCEVKIGEADAAVTASFARLPTFSLAVVKTGSGGGTVVSVPAGIECGVSCSHAFPEGARVVLSATANGTSRFAGWSGDGCSGTGSCEVTVAAASEVTAEFNELPQRSLTVVKTGSGSGSVSSSPVGIECGAVCSHAFNEGTHVVLTAVSNGVSTFSGTSVFVGWSGGGCSGKGPCEVTLAGATEVTAEFVEVQQETLTVSRSGSGAGTVTSSPGGIDCAPGCSHAFNEGTRVSLVATPSASSVFVGWSGGGCSGTGLCEVTLGSGVEVVAEFGSVAPVACSNGQLRSEQPLSSGLPDCRAFEVVSPADKNDSDALLSVSGEGASGRASVSGDAVTFESRGSFAGPLGTPFNSQYLSRRGPDGWSTRNISPPTSPNFGDPIQSQWQGADFTADLSSGVVVDGDPPLASGAPAGFENMYIADTANGSYEFVVAARGEPYEFDPTNVPQLSGASADMSHVVFEAGGEVFEWFDGVVSSVSHGPARTGASGTYFQSIDSLWHAVSADGSRVFFTTNEGQLSSEGQLFVRENESSTVKISVSQRSEPDQHGSGKALFWGASADGSRAFFTSTTELTNDANTGSADNAPNLYEYNIESGVLKDLSVDHADANGASAGGVLAMSEDGSYVYFVAAGDLAAGAAAGQQNLYLSHEGVTSFIATLSGSDSSDWSKGLLKNTVAITPDGTHFAFQSVMSLTGYDNEPQEASECGNGPCQEVYMFDAKTGALACASCNPSGARPSGPSSLDPHYNNTGDGYLYKPHNFSDDGRRLFFQSYDAIVQRDSNGRLDVYEYEDGTASLVSDGAGDYDSFLEDVSASGDDVFIATADQLVSQDQDNRVDLYDVRADGGFPALPTPPPACNNGDSCKPPVSPQPAGLGAPASATFTGAGNPAPASTNHTTSKKKLKQRPKKKHKNGRKAKKDRKTKGRAGRRSGRDAFVGVQRSGGRGR